MDFENLHCLEEFYPLTETLKCFLTVLGIRYDFLLFTTLLGDFSSPLVILLLSPVGFPDGSVGNSPLANAEDARDARSISESRRFPWRKEW